MFWQPRAVVCGFSSCVADKWREIGVTTLALHRRGREQQFTIRRGGEEVSLALLLLKRATGRSVSLQPLAKGGSRFNGH